MDEATQHSRWPGMVYGSDAAPEAEPHGAGATAVKGAREEAPAVRRGRLIIGNAFSLTMLPRTGLPGTASVKVRELKDEEARNLVRSAISSGKPVECAIGHQSTAQLAKQILGVDLNCERKMVKLTPEDTLLVIQLSFRAPEGKIYTIDELKKLLDEGKIAIYEVEYEPPPLFGVSHG